MRKPQGNRAYCDLLWSRRYYSNGLNAAQIQALCTACFED